MPDFFSTKYANKFFILSAIIFLIFKFGFVFFYTSVRDQPVEIDDAYVYIYRAVALKECPSLNCPVNQSMRNSVFNPSSQFDELVLQRRVAAMLYIFYTPVHAILLRLIHSTGLNWITSYKILGMLGAAYIAIAFILLASRLWRPLTAGLVLLFFSVLTFKGQGLSMVVPSNLSLATALIFIASITKDGPRLSLKHVLMAFLAIGLHPLGKVYLVAGLIAWILSSGRYAAIKNIRFLIPIGLLAVLESLLPAIFPNVIFSDKGFPGQIGNYWAGILLNYQRVFQILSPLAVLLFVIAGTLGTLWTFKKERDFRQKMNLWLVLALCGLSVVSIAHIYPSKPAELFFRVYIPAYFVLLGGVFELLLNLSWKKMGVAITAIFLIRQGVLGSQRYFEALNDRVIRHPWVLKTDNLQNLEKSNQPQNLSVLYWDEIPMIYSVAHGAWKYSSSYWKLLFDEQGKESHLINSTHIVAWNEPVKQLVEAIGNSPATLELSKLKSLHLSWRAQASPLPLAIKVKNPSHQNATLNVACEACAILPLSIPPNFDGWLNLSEKPIPVTQFKLSSSSPTEKYSIEGFRIGSQQDNLSWPWNKNFKIRIETMDNKSHETTFTSETCLNSTEAMLLLSKNHLNIVPLADEGTMMLFKITPL